MCSWVCGNRLVGPFNWEIPMIKNRSLSAWVAAVGVALVALGGVGIAQARDVNWSVGVSVPGVAVGVGNGYSVYTAPAPVYYAPPPPVYYAPPPPVYYAPPPPVYYAPPRPVYYAPPRPVYYAPAPVYYGPPAYPYYRDGRRNHRPDRPGRYDRYDRDDRNDRGGRGGWNR